jgi:potassium-transporting ATPase KdpC subunit
VIAMNDLYALYRHSMAGLRVMLGATLMLGVLYPLAVMGVARLTMPWQARGSLVTVTGAHTTDPARAVGSALLGQVTDNPALFYDRPSAAGRGYDPTHSSGTNLGPNDPRLVASIARLQQQVAAREDVAAAAVPADAVTASGSGLDPDISPAYAALQVPRVARATGLSQAAVRALVAASTHGRVWGVLGAPYVDVLTLNIAVRKAAH